MNFNSESLEYACFADYKPGTSANDVHKISRWLCSQIKRPSPRTIRSCIDKFDDDRFERLIPFLNPNVILVPVPRSAPILPGSAWPSLTIATMLQERGYGRLETLLDRNQALRKASHQSGATRRPSVEEHLETLSVTLSLLNSYKEITLVDDVVTQGRTSMACMIQLRKFLPEAKMRLFSMIRTQSFIDITEIRSFGVGWITMNPDTGATLREP